MCDKIEDLLHKNKVYTFNPVQHRLPCLGHVLNLAVTAVMSAVTNISAVETATTIWEFDPSLSDNRLGGTLDVVAAVRTLAIKVFLFAHAVSTPLITSRVDTMQRSTYRILRNTSRKLRY